MEINDTVKESSILCGFFKRDHLTFFKNLNRFGELVSDDKYRLKKYKPFISPNNNNILMYVYMTFSYLLAKSPTEK